MSITPLIPEKKPPNLTSGSKIYPYFLRSPQISSAQVWSIDITYLFMCWGFCHLTCVTNRASRRVLSWRLCNTLDASLCIHAAEIMTTGQGAQSTSEGFTSLLVFPVSSRSAWMTPAGGLLRLL